MKENENIFKLRRKNDFGSRKWHFGKNPCLNGLNRKWNVSSRKEKYLNKICYKDEKGRIGMQGSVLAYACFFSKMWNICNVHVLLKLRDILMINRKEEIIVGAKLLSVWEWHSLGKCRVTGTPTQEQLVLLL